MADNVKKIAGSRFIPQGVAPAEVEKYKQDLLAEVSRRVSQVLADGCPYLVRFRWDDARDAVGSTSSRIVRLEALLAVQPESAAAALLTPPS